ncbi:MAG: hypothetical protein LBE08_06885, partial [Bifidobacteriaceae bacterium]|nr:hypothetical protein [Bifidobacteriaceae bacterium]
MNPAEPVGALSEPRNKKNKKDAWMANLRHGLGAARRLGNTRRARGLAAVAIVVAFVGTAVDATGVREATASGPEAVALVIEPALVPEVLSQSGLVEWESRVDRRSVDTGMDVAHNTAYVWGYVWEGIAGKRGNSGLQASNYPPTPVIGLPENGIVEMGGQIYNMNALDKSGCVWGWGTYPGDDGTITSGSGRSDSAPPK